MGVYYSNHWHLGWVLWYLVLFLLIVSAGNWHYTYRAHKKYEDLSSAPKNAMDILNERYAKGELTRDDYNQIKADLLGESEKPAQEPSKKVG
ncbi:MAG: SHOCT domain-containing protein [Oligoflexia bacterium]|nr:SHOCT domain-containing protein [Oligoflexia bacterium]